MNTDTTPLSKEEILAKYLGWENFSPSPTIATTNEILAAMEQYAQQFQSPSSQSDAVELLRELCQLKHYKDTVGKDDFYEKTQPELWKKANEFLNSLVKTGQ
jgi:hypothetical protein